MSIMRIPLTKYGLPQVVAFPAMVLVVMVTVYISGKQAIMSPTAVFIVELIMGILLVWVLAFFRDPHRRVPRGDNILVAPADGKVTDIDVVEENDVIGGKALKIGIFLSIFDVHINRTPCAARIDKVAYKPGQYTNAMNPSSAQVNESNDIAMTRLSGPRDALLVRQISGAIARRIICRAEVGAEFACGERFGMIKFGSRTELYVPARDDLKCLAKVGDKVKAGETILAKYLE
ncbi:MAG: phosphatidylserine decarboxylase family protein [Planctomycetota bacterium]|nr:MAG: phosphatidylserine decarboxylase family protein [Planctomycetota bacterium]